MAGRIIYLNGTSSAGKTSIALALQDVLDESFLRIGVDTFIGMLPRRMFTTPPFESRTRRRRPPARRFSRGDSTTHARYIRSHGGDR